MLGRWCKQLEEYGAKAFPGQGHARDEEMMQLKRKNAPLKKERDFLIEAATFFVKEQK
jgi:transposase-like protein